MSYRGRLTAWKPKYTQGGARASVAGRSKIAALRAGVRKRNRAPRIKGAIASYGGRRELKYVDTAEASYICDTGSVTCLNLIAVGDDNTTRDGRQVTIKSVQGIGIVKATDNAMATCMARVMLVWDNAVNSTTIATVANILTSAAPTSFPLVSNEQRFTILSDQKFAIGQQQDTATSSFSSCIPQLYRVYKKLNHITHYSGTTAAIGSIQNGGLLLVVLGDQVSGDGATAKLAFRVRFTDN